MKAARIHKFGGPEVIVVDDVPRPVPAAAELLVRVAASGVGPWDLLIRDGKSKVSPQPPLTLGSDLSGVVEDFGAGISEFHRGDEVYGVTNPQFCGANAEYAIASSKMISSKPHRLSFAEAASVPVIAVTAWQMPFDHGSATAKQTALILGAAGNVGAYAVQLAVRAGLHVIAVVGSHDVAFAKGLGCDKIIDYKSERFEGSVHDVDLVIDTVGGDSRDRAINVIKPGGVLVSSVGAGSVLPQRSGVRSVFFYVEVTSDRLNAISQLFDTGELVPNVGTVLRLEDIRSAHEMLAGASHKRGKIVLQPEESGD